MARLMKQENWEKDKNDKTKTGLSQNWERIEYLIKRNLASQLNDTIAGPSVILVIKRINAAFMKLYNHDNGKTFKKYAQFAKNYKEPAQKEEPIQERLTRLITPLVKNALKGDSHGQKELHN